MGFGPNSISPVTLGYLRSTGSFAERVVSSGLVGNIQPTPYEQFKKIIFTTRDIIKNVFKRRHTIA